MASPAAEQQDGSRPPFPVPWTVYAVINGCRIAKEVRSEESVVRLTPEPDGRTFAAQID